MTATACVATTAQAEIGKRPASPKSEGLTIVLVGDVGLNRSNLPVMPSGIQEGRTVLTWKELTSKIAPLVDGDFNFMNLETVVTDRNDLRPGDKGQATPYLFRSHPAGVKHLLDLGFNLISAANNHAYDYGEAGAKETIRHLKTLTKSKKGSLFTGIGLTYAEAAEPASTTRKGVTLDFSSIGIVTNMRTTHRAGPAKAGTLGYRHSEDWEHALSRLVKQKGDLQLLSIHYGVERDIRTDERQRDAWRRAISDGVDVVVGHHAHVVRGIELHRGKPIFYGLGNFLIRGAANMGKKPELRTCCDYGLMSKLHYARFGGKLELAAVEVVPIFDMHRIARPLEPSEAKRRVLVLNVLAEELDDPRQKSEGMRFAIRKDGSGLYCTPMANRAHDAVKRMCQGYKGPSVVPADVRRRVERAPRATGGASKKGRKRGRR